MEKDIPIMTKEDLEEILPQILKEYIEFLKSNIDNDR